jgi:hypothetical protein
LFPEAGCGNASRLFDLPMKAAPPCDRFALNAAAVR